MVFMLFCYKLKATAKRSGLTILKCKHTFYYLYEFVLIMNHRRPLPFIIFLYLRFVPRKMFNTVVENIMSFSFSFDGSWNIYHFRNLFMNENKCIDHMPIICFLIWLKSRLIAIITAFYLSCFMYHDSNKTYNDILKV